MVPGMQGLFLVLTYSFGMVQIARQNPRHFPLIFPHCFGTPRVSASSYTFGCCFQACAVGSPQTTQGPGCCLKADISTPLFGGFGETEGMLFGWIPQNQTPRSSGN